MIRLLPLQVWWGERGIGDPGPPVQQVEQIRYSF